MEIKNLLEGLDPYQKKAKIEKQEADAARSRARSEGTSSGDKVSLSSAARLRTVAHNEAAAAPDVRQEKIAALKAQVESGEYEVDSKKVAEKLLKEELDLFI